MENLSSEVVKQWPQTRTQAVGPNDRMHRGMSNSNAIFTKILTANSASIMPHWAEIPCTEGNAM